MAKSLVLKVAISPQHSPDLYASLVAMSDPRMRTAMLRVWAEAGLALGRNLPATPQRSPEPERRLLADGPHSTASSLDPRPVTAIASTPQPTAASDPPSPSSVEVVHPSLAGLDIDALSAAIGEYGG